MSDYPFDPRTSESPEQGQGTGATGSEPTEVRPTVSVPPIPGEGAAGATGAATDAGATGATGAAGTSESERAAHAAEGWEGEGARKPRRTVRAVVAGLLGGVVGAAALTGVLLATGVVGPTGTQVTSGSSGQAITIDPSDEDTSTANAVAAKASPSVVTVYCTFADGSGSGSGVVYDTDGNIITNNHVIENAQSIQVTAADGNTYDAELVGTDASSDIAVIHADFGDAEVTPIEVGDSSELQVGDWVMSVGSPFGLENSVSQGIVSALSRNTLLESTSGNTLYTNLIQTDATINPGNSGGALVNSQGRLVGICTLYSSDTQSFAGIGYAIPSDYATEIADKVIAGETVTHAYIGLSMQTVNNQTAYQNNLAVSEGAYVVEVTEGSPADTAGIEVGDVITRIGDAQITSADAAILAVRSHSIGETVQVTVVRGSQEMTFDVTLGSDESLQQEQQNQQEDTVQINGQDISLQDLIDLYQQYQEQQYSPFGGR